MKMTFGIEKVTLHLSESRDRIYFDFEDTLDREVHGPYYEWNKGSGFVLETARGHGHSALKALGVLYYFVLDHETGISRQYRDGSPTTAF